MKTVLLADDEANLRTLVRTTLEGLEYRVVEAHHGLEALEKTRVERPDVLVLDWMMPHMSGIDVLRALRADPSTANLPVIFLTARGQQSDRAEAAAAGNAVYLTKPFSPLELLEKVEEASRQVTELAETAARELLPETPADSASQLALYARDLSRMVEAERERARQLAEANARLLRLDRLKVDFLTFISHELRTPLNHIAACDMYDQTLDPTDQAAIMRIVRSGYEWLDGFIRQGLTYFDWMAVERVDDARQIDLGALVRMTADQLLDGRDRLDLQIDATPAALEVCGAPDALATAVKALLANALKFSPAPARVQVRLAAAQGEVVLHVQDLGCGFAPELGDEIFRPFTVADALHHARGTGLSLALTGAIVQAHGGRATAHSGGPGTGATFTVALPRAAVRPAEPSS